MRKIRQGGCWPSENHWRPVSRILAQSTCDKSVIAAHDRRGCLTRRQPPRRTFFAASAALAASCFLAAPAWPQAKCIVPAGVDTNPSGTSFFSSFANSKYEIPMLYGNGANVNGDLNSTYFQMFYSITNLNTWMAAHNYCPVELIVVGTFSDVRYFSVTDNDMHYAATQHLADADIDPVGAPGSSYSNPFTPGVQYNGNQKYLVPVSLGYLPSSTTVPGCSISPFEEDNLLDATQRHLSMDWNTNVQGNSPTVAHVVDTPEHTAGPNNSGPNSAGSITLRNYLAPPLTCTGAPGSVSCSPQQTPVQQPYVIVRDVQTGCAYSAAWLEPPTNDLVYMPPHTTPTPNCALIPSPPGCGAILSTRDLSAQNVSNWLDLNQRDEHTINDSITPQACYANGSPNATPPLPFANEVAWARSPEYVMTPGPDDSYIGAAVSSSDLTGMLIGSSCTQQQSGDGCVIRFRFQLPPVPNTPCQAPYSSCGLNGSEQLRYSSLTFGYQSATPANLLQNNVAYPDGIDATTANTRESLVSLADNAFAKTPGRTGGTAGNNYVTLIVNVGATLPAWLQQTTAGAMGVTGGVQPVLNPNTNDSYSVWQVQGYTVLDLSQFSDAGFTISLPLMLTIRNTLPSSTFGCSGAAVPFSMAEYTNEDGNGGGLMGPYVPLVDYVDAYSLPQPAGVPPSLPSASSCGVLANNESPSFNVPTEQNQLDFPQQYWPPSATYSLSCGTVTALPPQIYFVATQFATPATTAFGQSCDTATQPNPCNQIIEQSAQTTESSATWQPPLPVTIVGTNFGFLPSAGLPLAVASSNYLEVSDDGAGSGLPWNTNNALPSCQMYIANWTNTNISLAANLPVGVTDMYQPGVVLSPLNDVSPLTFGAARPTSTTGCPVASGDHLTFTITNPQSGATSHPITVPVSPTGTTPY
jgi:hypothetical protein